MDAAAVIKNSLVFKVEFGHLTQTYFYIINIEIPHK